MIRSTSAVAAAIALCASVILAGPAGAWDRRPYYPPPYHQHYHHRDHGGDIALGVGLGIIGLGMTAAMMAPPAYYAPPPPPVVYYPPPLAVVPPPALTANPVSGDYFTPDGRQCREYQTSLVVNGRRQQAYGTACLDGNGTWRVVR